MVGEYQAGLLVEGQILVELKACRGLTEAHTGQALNYLTAKGLKACLPLNFGKARIQVRRVSRDKNLQNR